MIFPQSRYRSACMRGVQRTTLPIVNPIWLSLTVRLKGGWLEGRFSATLVIVNPFPHHHGCTLQFIYSPSFHFFVSTNGLFIIRSPNIILTVKLNLMNQQCQIIGSFKLYIQKYIYFTTLYNILLWMQGVSFITRSLY